MDVANPSPAPLVAVAAIGAPPLTPVRVPRPSSSGGSTQRGPLSGDSSAGGRGAGGGEGAKALGATPGAAGAPGGHKASGRGPAAPAVAAAAAVASASPTADPAAGERRGRSQSSVTSTPSSSARKAPSAASATGGVAAASPRPTAPPVPRALFKQEAADGLAGPLPPGAARPASPGSGAGAWVDSAGGAASTPPASARRSAAAAAPRPLSRTSSDASRRSEGPLAHKPPLPGHPAGGAGLGAGGPQSPQQAESPAASGVDVVRPVLKRSSSSSSISGLTPDGRALADGDGDGIATVRTGAVAAAVKVGGRERRVSSGQSAVSRTAAAGTTATTVEKLPFRTPRESSCSGVSKDGSQAAAASLLLPFRSPSGSQQPPYPVQLNHQERTPKQQQQQQHPQHSSHPNLQQRQPQPQQHAQQHAASRAVRFTREGSNSNLSSPLGPALTPTQHHRRVSDSSSHLSYSPVGGRDQGLLMAVPPPPPGLLIPRRPSDDAIFAAAGSVAAPLSGAPPPGSRRNRPVRSGSSSEAGGTMGANVIWARATGPDGAAAAQPRPPSGCGSGSTSASGVRESKRASVDEAAQSPSGATTAAAGIGKLGHGRAAAAAAAASAASGGIRRAVDLEPMSMPGGLDGGLREALARAAVANVAHLASGSLLPEQDFGYARVVDEHRRQHQRLEQQQQQQQQQRQRLQQQPQQQRQQQQQQDQKQDQLHQQQQQQQPQQQSKQAVSQPEERSSGGRASLQVDSGAGGSAAAAAGTATPVALAVGAPAPSPPASPRDSAGPTSTKSTLRPPLGARSMRSVLKATPAPASPGISAAAKEPKTQAQAPSPSPAAALTTTSYRFLALRRPSSKASAPDSEADTFTSPATTTGGGTDIARGSAWSNVFGSAVSAGSGRVPGGAAADADPMGLRTAENVEIRIHCLTFNMGGVVPAAAVLPESLFSGSYLSPDAAADSAHLYVFATQESGPLADWEAAVAAHLGRRYARVAAESLMSIHILLFAVRSMAPYITDVQTSSVATGVGNVLGNKGGVAVTFTLLGARVLLVGAHFAAHDQNVERRNADFHRICAGLFAPPSSDGTAGAAAGGVPTAPSMPRSAQVTPERTRGGATADSSASGKLTSDSPPAVAGGGGGGQAPARNGTAQRRAPLGPTLSRFSRSGASSVAGTSVSEEADSAGGCGGGDGGESYPARTLTRALSTSSVSSMASNVSHAPEGALRTRMQSFLGGVSFATAQRHSTALLEHFDVVLWMGDLNYRIAGTPEVVKYAIDENMMEVLRANDQLQKQKKKGKVLQGFLEMPIAFAPTYKFSRGTDDYDLRRAPSWTDRVLYLVNADPMFADLRPLYYMSVPELRTSDHKPVIAGFELSISPQHAGDSRHARQRGCVIS